MKNENSSILTRVLSTISQAVSEFDKMMKLKFRMKNSVIEFPFRISYVDNVHVGRNVWIGKDAWFNLGEKCHLYIGEGTKIGRSCMFSGKANSILIGKNVLIAPRVYIATSRHKYEDVTEPVIKQGSLSKGNVTIEDDGWIGIGACIMPNVTIGKHSVIGANAVVIHDIPPYSVAIGNPAEVIKKYVLEQKRWVSVKSNNP